MKTCLILGRNGTIVEEVRKALNRSDIQIEMGTTYEDVVQAFQNNAIDTVIMGAGLDLEIRLQIIQYIFEHSKSTTIHMKDWDSGPAGMLPFVRNVLAGL